MPFLPRLDFAGWDFFPTCVFFVVDLALLGGKPLAFHLAQFHLRWCGWLRCRYSPAKLAGVRGRVFIGVFSHSSALWASPLQ